MNVQYSSQCTRVLDKDEVDTSGLTTAKPSKNNHCLLSLHYKNIML